jgi:hypothetical protein
MKVAHYYALRDKERGSFIKYEVRYTKSAL